MTTTPMKRAGQLIAHLDILHQIHDVRQLLLLQHAMRERQDQVALFRREPGTSDQPAHGTVTLQLIGRSPARPPTPCTTARAVCPPHVSSTSCSR